MTDMSVPSSSRPLWRRLATSEPLIGIIALLAVVGILSSLIQGSGDLFTMNLVLLAALGATGLNLAMGVAGLISVGTAAFIAVGGFITYIAQHAGVPFPFDVLIGTLAAGVAGTLLCLPALRLRGIYLALSTVAVHYIILFIAQRYQTDQNKPGGFASKTLFTDFGLREAQVRWALVNVVILALIVLIVHAVSDGRAGRALRIIRDHEVIAPSLGINVVRYKATALFISSAIMGLEGGLTAYFTGSVSVDSFTFLLAVQYLAMVLLGGTGRLFGGILGAAVVVSLPTLLPHAVGGLVDGSDVPAASTMIYGILVVIVVLRFPRGLAGISLNRSRKALARRDAQLSSQESHGASEAMAVSAQSGPVE